MSHDDAADHSGTHTEAALVHVLQLTSLVQETRVERTREVVAQIVASPCLQSHRFSQGYGGCGLWALTTIPTN